ncbi:MAG: bifunctional hexulose-6-phosphate synthase/ribonuclease regulator [Candidatus Altiarchaeales archaeon]|nr:bifunctional hexulose-6-phosphate synthase/ribonuclease regulator [Candidatus Altiarchaeales archaeon]
MDVKIQLALDFVDLDRAIKCLDEAFEYVDFIEAGTPLIKSEGLECVRQLKRRSRGKPVVADMKIMDAGRIEVEAASKAGADYVDVCAQAGDETVIECVDSALNVGAKVVADLIGVPNPLVRAERMQQLGVEVVTFHQGIDRQMKGASSFKHVMAASQRLSIPLGCAGGLTSESAVDAVSAGASIIVVGGAITKAEYPGEAAKKIRQAVDSMKKIPTKHFTRTKELYSLLAGVSCANLSDAQHRRGVLAGITPLCGDFRFAGPAVTVRTYPGDWAKPVEAVDVASQGDVLVITQGGVPPACWGELATESAQRKKLSAVVVDGAVRDAKEIIKMGFPVYAKHVCPNAGEPKGFGEINVPLNIGGVTIKPGDIVVGDADGVVVVPQGKAVEIANRAHDVLERENRIREEIKENSSLSKVTHLIKWEKTN